MHENNFKEYSKHRILQINSVERKGNTIKAVLTTAQFDRVTTKPYWMDYKEYLEIIERMYI